MKVHETGKKAGCLPGIGSVALLVIGVAVMVGAYFWAGPGTTEVGGFVEAVRRGRVEDAEPLAVPELGPRIHRAVDHHPEDEPIYILSGGDSGRSLVFGARKGERCYLYLGARSVPVYVTALETPEGWRVAQVSFDAAGTEVCKAAFAD